MGWRLLSDPSLSLVRRCRAVPPGVRRVSGDCARPSGSAVAPCQAAANDRKPRPGWPASRSGPQTGRQPCPPLPAAGLRAGLANRRSAPRSARRRTRALSHDAKQFGPTGGSGLDPADIRNATERSSSAEVYGAQKPPLGLPDRESHDPDGRVGPNGPCQDLESDRLGIPQSAAIPAERPTTRMAVRPKVTDEGAH